MLTSWMREKWVAADTGSFKKRSTASGKLKAEISLELESTAKPDGALLSWLSAEIEVSPSCAGFDPRIHLLTRKDGLHRTSGLPEVRTFKCRKSGRPDVRC